MTKELFLSEVHAHTKRDSLRLVRAQLEKKGMGEQMEQLEIRAGNPLIVTRETMTEEFRLRFYTASLLPLLKYNRRESEAQKLEALKSDYLSHGAVFSFGHVIPFHAEMKNAGMVRQAVGLIERGLDAKPQSFFDLGDLPEPQLAEKIGAFTEFIPTASAWPSARTIAWGMYFLARAQVQSLDAAGETAHRQFEI